MYQSAKTYEETYQQLFNLLPPDSITIGESTADIIRPARGFVDGFDMTMQTQVGCPAGCLFCYVPSGRMLTPGAVRGESGERWGFEVRPKQDVLELFQGHLERGELAGKSIYWSGVTDPYATPSGQTRGIWELLCAAESHLRPRRMIVQTRFRPDRDVEQMAEYERSTLTSDGGPAVVVSYSIGTDRDDLIRAWERATPSYETRMDAIQTLREAGIWVVPTLSPFGLWNDLPTTLGKFREWDIPYITALFFKRDTNSANTPWHFLAYLEREYPMLLDPSWQKIQTKLMQLVYGKDRVLFGKSAFASLAAPHQLSNASAFSASARGRERSKPRIFSAKHPPGAITRRVYCTNRPFYRNQKARTNESALWL
jgi:DNA repair photolyase